MSWSNLPTNYQDAAWNGSRKFNMTKNQDGTYSFEDVTEYTQIDNAYRSAEDVNATNDAINTIMGIFEGAYRLLEPTNVTLKNQDRAVDLTWNDPVNGTVPNDITVVQWAGTKVVRKQGSAPQNENDGTVVIDSKIRDKYITTPYTDTNVSNNTNYFYGFFPYTPDGKYTISCIREITPTAITLTAPTIDNIIATGTNASISFTNPNNAGKLKLVYKKSSSPSSASDGTVVDNILESPVYVDGLTKNSTYYFRLYAYTNSNTSASTAVSASTLYGTDVYVRITGLPSGKSVTLTLTDKTNGSFSKVISNIALGQDVFVNTIPENDQYEITVNDIVKYQTPSKISDTASGDNTENYTIAYQAYPTLQQYSWAEIDQISSSGTAPQHFEIGDEKTLTFNNVTYTAVIIGFGLVTNSSTGKKAGITFSFKEVINEQIQLTIQTKATYNTSTNLWVKAPYNIEDSLNAQIINAAKEKEALADSSWFSYVKPRQYGFYYPEMNATGQSQSLGNGVFTYSISGSTTNDTAKKSTYIINNVKLFPFSTASMFGYASASNHYQKEQFPYYSEKKDYLENYRVESPYTNFNRTRNTQDGTVIDAPYCLIHDTSTMVFRKYVDAQSNIRYQGITDERLRYVQMETSQDNYGNSATFPQLSTITSLEYADTLTTYLLVGFSI